MNGVRKSKEMRGRVIYIGHANSYQISLGDRIVTVGRNKEVALPLWKCKELVEKVEHFVPTPDTAEILGKYAWNKIDGLKKMMGGRRIFIIGSGPSLKGFDFSRLDGDFTITINHVSRYYPKSTIMMFLDKKFIKECKPFIDSYRGIIFSSYRSGYDANTGQHKAFYCFPTNRREITNDVNMGLFNGELTGLCALNLALILGCQPIYLLGFDLNNKPPWYFFDDEFTAGKHYRENKIKRVLSYFNRFRSHGRNRIFNCSKDSAIKDFKYIDVNTVLGKGARKAI